MSEWFWSGKPWQAFKNFAILFSFTMNLILLIILLISAPLIIPIVSRIAAPLVSGLNQSFVEMGEANIVRTIEVHDDIPISFELPVSAETDVLVTESVPMALPTSFVLPAGGGTINGTVFFELPEGMLLPVQFDIVVPVDQTVPVNLAVDVDIPLAETELGPPFEDLQALFAPLDHFLSNLPASNRELYQRLLDSGRLAAAEPTVDQATAP